MELKNKPNMKIIALIIVSIIIVGAIGYSFYKKPFSPDIVINPEDKEFYDEYPGLPFGPTVLIGDALWGNYNTWVGYAAIQTVQITPTIENIAQQFIDQYPDDIYERVNATYMFVASNIKARETVEHYQYPVTTLQTMKGGCAESAALLASILYAEGLSDVAFVITNGTNLPHAYVTVRLPTPTEAANPVEEQIKGYLDDNWIAMDSTNDWDGNYLEFRELKPDRKAHYDIHTIVKVPIYGCVFDYEFEFIESDPQLGNCMGFQCDLAAFENGQSENISFTFQMMQNGVAFSSYTIYMTPQSNLSIQHHNFKLDIDDEYWANYVYERDQWYFGLEIRNN